MSKLVTVFLSADLPDTLAKAILQIPSVRRVHCARIESIASPLSGIGIAVVRGSRKFDARCFDLFPDLELLVCFGVGTDGIELNAAARRRVQVCNSPASNAVSVAEHAVLLCLAAMRRLLEFDAIARNGRDETLAPGMELAGKRIGVIGYGNVGKRAADLFSAFGCQVGYCARSKKINDTRRYFARARSLAGWADVLVLCAPDTAATRGIVDAKILESLGPDGILVNVSRDSLVVVSDLVYALEHKKIAGAGLDVFSDMLEVSANLRRLNRVVLTPHVAARTREAHTRMFRSVVRNIGTFLIRGKPAHALRKLTAAVTP